MRCHRILASGPFQLKNSLPNVVARIVMPRLQYIYPLITLHQSLQTNESWCGNPETEASKTTLLFMAFDPYKHSHQITICNTSLNTSQSHCLNVFVIHTVVVQCMVLYDIKEK